MQKVSVQSYFFFLVGVLTVAAFVLGGGWEVAAMEQAEDISSMEKKVASLKLGFGAYYISTELTPEQKQMATQSLAEKSYPGTYTFTSGDIYILVEKEHDMILAVYKKQEESGKEQMQRMVAELMTQFGSPTSEAHDQIIYWAFGEQGKVTDKEYDEQKKEEKSNILATVKFKSKLTFSEMEADAELKNDFHCIVSAPRLLEKFYQQ